MTNPQKAKGDSAEREIAALINALTGWPVRRKLGAGRMDDAGDLDGIPDCTAQVKNYADVGRAVREALYDLEQQRLNAGTTHAVAFIRRAGGRWIAVQTVEQWATTHREATA
jgi:hypothetical protein